MALLTYLCCIFDNQVNHDEQRSLMLAPAGWKENGSIGKWTNLLKKFKTADSPSKWRILIHLKREGIKVGFEEIQISPSVHKVTVKLDNLIDFTDTGKDPVDACNHALKKLVRFLKHLARLEEDFREIFNPATSPLIVMERLANRNPKALKIRATGSDDTRHSVLIEIVNLLTATEADESRMLAKLAVSTKVVEYMMKLCKIKNIIPTEENEEVIEEPIRCFSQQKFAKIGETKSVTKERSKSI